MCVRDTCLAPDHENSHKWTGRQTHEFLPKIVHQPHPELPARSAVALGCLWSTQTAQTQQERAWACVRDTCLAPDDENSCKWTGRQAHEMLAKRAHQPPPELPARSAVASGCLWATQTAQTQQEHARGCVWDTCLASDGRNSY